MILAYRPDIVATPIAEALAEKGWQTTPEADPGKLIADGKADVAIGPALGYGRHLGLIDYALVPGFALMINGPSSLIRLVFPPGRSDLRKIAVRSRREMETVLAGIVLMEKHELEPEFVDAPASSDLDEMLAMADGAVVWGEESLRSAAAGRSALDLPDEWIDMTGESLPWLLAWGRVDRVGDGTLEELRQVREEFSLRLPDRALADRSAQTALELLHRSMLTEAVSFDLDPEEASARLTPFFHYAFYHGIITDIPTIKHLPIEVDGNAE